MPNAIGLMSGTSLDGVDVAWLRTDGEEIESFGPTGYRPYSAAERNVLRAALDAAPRIVRREEGPAEVGAAEELITRAHAEAVESFLATNRIDRRTVDVVGFHGQTVLHRPHDRLTVQIGDGAALAKELGLPVVYDFRAADVAAGGQGAPLVPVYHRALARLADCAMPACIVNIGGVANVTYIDGDTLIACDTGPGNALLDDYLLRHTGKAMDRDGLIAAQGDPDMDWVAQALEHPFFDAPAPKSLDRNDFMSFAVDGMTLENGAATLTAFTALSIARIVDQLPSLPSNWVVAGGGANNPTLMRMLSEQLAPMPVMIGHDLGWKGDAIEAQAFAYLAVRSLKGLPLTYPGTTGVSAPLTGGVLARP